MRVPGDLNGERILADLCGAEPRSRRHISTVPVRLPDFEGAARY